jgi:transcriptional regulator with XRE-family HTH domain
MRGYIASGRERSTVTTGHMAHTTAVTIDDLLGRSVRRRRAFEHRSDVLEAAALIRELRHSASISQEELANRLGTHQSRISELERGDGPQGPTFTMLKRIARACDDSLVIVTKKFWRHVEREFELMQQFATTSHHGKSDYTGVENSSRILHLIGEKYTGIFISLEDETFPTPISAETTARPVRDIEQRIPIPATEKQSYRKAQRARQMKNAPRGIPDAWIAQTNKVAISMLH